MTHPTTAEAIAYVTSIETSWGLTPRIVAVGIDHQNEGLPLITTADNIWTVWFQPDGTLYGEC